MYHHLYVVSFFWESLGRALVGAVVGMMVLVVVLVVSLVVSVVLRSSRLYLVTSFLVVVV